MKHYPLFITVLLILFVNSVALATNPHYMNDVEVYVWDFSVDDTQIQDIARRLTNDFETEVINSRLYKGKVVERRRFDKVRGHEKMLERILGSLDSIYKVEAEQGSNSKTIFAILGSVSYDEGSGEYEVSAWFQTVGGDASKTKKGSVLIPKGMINDNKTRKEYMKKLFTVLHADEIAKEKRHHFDEISSVLNQYLVQVKNVQKSFEDIGSYALENQSYFDELITTVTTYNKIFEKINGHHDQYYISFASYWPKDQSDELSEIFDGILKDIHERIIIGKLDKVRLDIIRFRTEVSNGNLSKKEKVRKQGQLDRDINKVTGDLLVEINLIDRTITGFLRSINQEMALQN